MVGVPPAPELPICARRWRTERAHRTPVLCSARLPADASFCAALDEYGNPRTGNRCGVRRGTSQSRDCYVCRALTRARKRTHIVRDTPRCRAASCVMAATSRPGVSVHGGLSMRRHGGVLCSRLLSVVALEMTLRLMCPSRRNRSVRFDQFEVPEAARPTGRCLRAQALVEYRPGGRDSFTTSAAFVHVALGHLAAPSAAAARKLPIRGVCPIPEIVKRGRRALRRGPNRRSALHLTHALGSSGPPHNCRSAHDLGAPNARTERHEMSTARRARSAHLEPRIKAADSVRLGLT